MAKHYAGRTPADWDDAVWSDLEALFQDAWRLPESGVVDLARQMFLGGYLIGGAAAAGPLLALQLREVVDGVLDHTAHEGLRELIRRAALNTGGDESGLSDFAMALRDGSRLLLMCAKGEARSGTSAHDAFLNAKAQMLGLSQTSPEEAFGA